LKCFTEGGSCISYVVPWRGSLIRVCVSCKGKPECLKYSLPDERIAITSMDWEVSDPETTGAEPVVQQRATATSCKVGGHRNSPRTSSNNLGGTFTTITNVRSYL
jgi:hypothetical protein